MNDKRAILFDLDGTLIDTTNLVLRCFDHSWQLVCGQNHSREVLIETFGIPLREAMRRLLVGSRYEAAACEALVERLLAEYRSFNVANHDLLARPFDRARQVIEALRSRGYLIGVVTSKGRELALRGLSLCALSDLIDAAVFLEDTGRHKPEPDPILTALERLKVSARRAAYIGDSRYDILAGKAAGVMTVAALWGPSPRAELEEQRPDRLVENIIGLLDIFPDIKAVPDAED